MWKYLALFFLSLALLLPAQSQAQGVREYTNRADAFFGEVYLGLKYGIYELYDDDLNDGDEAEMGQGGIVFGKSINDVLGWEFEYTTTVSKEDEWLDADLNVETESVGIYLTAKAGGDVYVKGRVGYLRVEQDISLFKPYNAYGIGYGVGGGFKFAKGLALEIEYTVLPEEERSASGIVAPGVPASFDFDIESEMLTVGLIWSFE